MANLFMFSGFQVILQPVSSKNNLRFMSIHRYRDERFRIRFAHIRLKARFRQSRKLDADTPRFSRCAA